MPETTTSAPRAREAGQTAPRALPRRYVEIDEVERAAIGAPSCSAAAGGWLCTRNEGHAGPHVAQDADVTSAVWWDDEPTEPSKPRCGPGCGGCTEEAPARADDLTGELVDAIRDVARAEACRFLEEVARYLPAPGSILTAIASLRRDARVDSVESAAKDLTSFVRRLRSER